VDYEKVDVTPAQLLLDPNNYRFHDLQGYNAVRKFGRYQEPGVQQQALKLLKETTAFDFSSLKDSIRTNGYIPIEQIVVVPYEDDGQPNKRYLVIEGNRRAACVKTLLEESQVAAVDLLDNVKQSIDKISVVVLKGSPEEVDSYKRTLMAIRHVAGIREWGPYQQAKLVVEMFEEEGATLGSVAQKIGISAKEVARRYRASKALKQMEDDDEFSDSAEPRLYVFFHEAVSQPKVREWLGFSNETYKAENDDARHLFFELLSPREVDGEKRSSKLTSANQQVRQLKDIVDKPYAVEVLADPEKSFDDAVRAAQADVVEDEEGLVERCLATAIATLKKPGLAYMDAGEQAKQLWVDFLAQVEKITKIFPK
jgi:hypothetical protein